MVISYLSSFSKIEDLDLKVLSKKLLVLLAIISSNIFSEIARLYRQYMTFNTEGVLFTLPGLSKTQTDCTPRQLLQSFSRQRKIVCSELLKENLKRSRSFGEENGGSNPLLVQLSIHTRVSLLHVTQLNLLHILLMVPLRKRLLKKVLSQIKHYI